MKLNRIKKTSAQELELNGGLRILLSYQTPVAAWIPKRGFVRTSKFHSVTTSKHINSWLNTEAGGSPLLVAHVEQQELDTLLDGVK